MLESSKNTSKRKKEHIDICLNKQVDFISKTNGFEKYSFEHYAITELAYSKIDQSSELFSKKIDYPFIIACMTGGVREAVKINEKLAEAASTLNIPIGVGSQRQALEDNKEMKSYKVIRDRAKNVPLLGNIGASQIASSKSPLDLAERLFEMIDADALYIHLNPLQELFQPEGEPDFSGFLKNLEKITNKISKPIFVKEVGAGISKTVSKKLLNIGVEGIDVAGAGGTSWAGVEMTRNDNMNEFFWDWGIPTADCIVEVNELRKKYKFTLIASGGITNGIEIAKAIALGADLASSAKPLMVTAINEGSEGVINKISSWFEDVRKIMYLTDNKNLAQLKNSKMLRRTF